MFLGFMYMDSGLLDFRLHLDFASAETSSLHLNARESSNGFGTLHEDTKAERFVRIMALVPLASSRDDIQVRNPSSWRKCWSRG